MTTELPIKGDPHRKRLLRRLHALARDRGLAHDDLHDVVGVASLLDATPGQLVAAIRRLSSPSRGEVRPSGRGEGRAPNPRKRRARPDHGTIKLPTPKQRALIQRLLKRLGWASVTILQRLGDGWEPEPGSGAIDGRYWNPTMTAGDASQAINTLIGECKRLRM